jgi:sortase (surface protein transpeptidase)
MTHISASCLRVLAGLVALIMTFGLSACQPVTAPTPAPDPNTTAAPTRTASQLVEIEPLQPDQAAAPVRLQIPDVELDVPVTPMGWIVAMVDGKRTTVWDVPENAAGWHLNSSGAGTAGNVIISGRQAGGAAIFAPLALGEIQLGQEVWLTDSDGLIFVYTIEEITDPIPVASATAEEEARAAAYLANSDDAKLTLITGWPDFTTTHRVIAVAGFTGVIQ